MGTHEKDGRGPDERTTRRRNVLKTVGGLVVVGSVGTGQASAKGHSPGGGRGPPETDERGPPEGRGQPGGELGERTIEWEGQGSEHATQDCAGTVGYWHWILTPGGSTAFESVGELEVTFEDESVQKVLGSQKGNGAYHFDVRKSGGGTVESAEVVVVDGGRNSLLTISDGECEEADTLYWQVDFGEGEVKDPPKYWPDDVMAALGNSDDGVTENPSFARFNSEGQLADVDIDGNSFTFDDEADPSQVTVEFTIDADGDTRDLHLSSWILPGEYDGNEVDQQEWYDSTVEEFEGGDHGTLTIDIPRRE